MSHYSEGSGDLRRVIATERRAQLNQYIIMAVALFFLATYGAQWWQIQQAIKIDSIAVSNVRVVGPSSLCPGDRLVVRFDLDVQGFGILISDGTTYYEGQPVTYSESRRIPGDGPAMLTLTDDWIVPAHPDMMIHGSRGWIPGEYERLVTLAPSSSWVSRFVEPQKFTVPITLAEDCS